jgi:hypothetical protein
VVAKTVGCCSILWVTEKPQGKIPPIWVPGRTVPVSICCEGMQGCPPYIRHQISSKSTGWMAQDENKRITTSGGPGLERAPILPICNPNAGNLSKLSLKCTFKNHCKMTILYSIP